MPLTRIALIGATSRIGPAILAALSQASSFTITILQRLTSKPTPSYPHTRTVVIPSDPATTSDLTAVLTGHDALVCALHPSTLDLQLRLADACVAVGVRRYILADYGSVESDDPAASTLVPLFAKKTQVREYCQRLAEESRKRGDGGHRFDWTALVTGHFFDDGLASHLLGFDLREGFVRLFDGGEGRWSTSTVAQIGRAVAGVLDREEETAGRVLYVQSFCVSQMEALDAVDTVRCEMGLEALERRWMNAEQYVEEMKREMEAGSYMALEQIVCVLGLTRARWEGKDGFANGLLGLEEEDVRVEVRKVLDKVYGSDK